MEWKGGKGEKRERKQKRAASGVHMGPFRVVQGLN